MASEFHQSRKRNRSENLDGINSLPNEVICKILGHLPLREAVGTSRLSRTWRYRWMYMTELRFTEDSAIQGQTFDERIKFINNVLLLHVGKITKFVIRRFLYSASPDVGPWLLLLSRKKLSHLDIRFPQPSLYMLPSSLFYCQDLSTLVLECCALQLPPRTQFNGFKNLTSLCLVNVTANNETLELLVNTSPFLQNLFITLWTSVISHLNISAPNLRICDICGCFEVITFVITPKLRHATIKTWLRREFTRSGMDGILGGLVKIQMAKFSYPFIKFLSINNFLERLPITYCHLIRLRLDIDFEDLKQILAALWLFRSSPSLKTLDIDVGRVNKGVYNEYLCLEEVYETLDRKEAILQSLETFNLQGFGGSENELRFIQFMLLNASVLQTMKITWTKDARAPIRERAALLKLVEFQRTSSGVKVKLHG